MMKASIRYEFEATVWQHAGPGGWFFVSLPMELSSEIRTALKWQEEGWGRLKATAKIGETTWDTAVWFDTKNQTYLLPIKSMVRQKEKVNVGKKLKVVVWI